MKTVSKFRKNRRSRTTNKKRGGKYAHGIQGSKSLNTAAEIARRKDLEKQKKNKKSKAAYKGMNFPVDKEEYERKEIEKIYEKTKENSQREAEINRKAIEDCEKHTTLHDWNEPIECSNIYDVDRTRNINFFKDTVAGKKIAETWPDICPDSKTYEEFLKNGCYDWEKDGEYYTWEDTEAGKKANEGQMDKCMNIATENDFDNESCHMVELGKDGNHKPLRWFDTNEGEKDLKAKQEGCMTDKKMIKKNFDAYDCDKLGHVWRESAAYKEIEREEHIRSINGLKNVLFANLNDVLKSIKGYAKVATNPEYSIGKEIYQLIYENKHPRMAKVMKNWDHFNIRDKVKNQVNDFVNNQEENEQNKIRKYVENNRTYLKHNKHIADLINEKIGELNKEMEGAKKDVVENKKKRIEELNSVLPKKLFITPSDNTYEMYKVTDEEKEEIKKEIEEQLNKGAKDNNLELIEETRGGKRERKRKRKTKKSKKSKRRTRRRHK